MCKPVKGQIKNIKSNEFCIYDKAMSFKKHIELK